MNKEIKPLISVKVFGDSGKKIRLTKMEALDFLIQVSKDLVSKMPYGVKGNNLSHEVSTSVYDTNMNLVDDKEFTCYTSAMHDLPPSSKGELFLIKVNEDFFNLSSDIQETIMFKLLDHIFPELDKGDDVTFLMSPIGQEEHERCLVISFKEQVSEDTLELIDKVSNKTLDAPLVARIEETDELGNMVSEHFVNSNGIPVSYGEFSQWVDMLPLNIITEDGQAWPRDNVNIYLGEEFFEFNDEEQKQMLGDIIIIASVGYVKPPSDSNLIQIKGLTIKQEEDSTPDNLSED